MSLLQYQFESKYTGSSENVYIILPDRKRTETPEEFYGNGKKYPVLWLLHGTFGDYSDWLRKTMIEVYAEERNCIVVLPSAGNSDYDKWDNFNIGYDTCQYVVNELMPFVYNWLPASKKREDNFIAGLSMGGRGAMQFALTYPEKFAAAAILSSMPRNYDDRKEEFETLFNKPRKELLTGEYSKDLRQYNTMHRYDSVDEYLNSMSNTWRKLKDALDHKVDLPRFMFAIGTEDKAYPDMIRFRAYAEEIGFDYYYTEGPGRHEWRVWDRDIEKAFDFFKLEKIKKVSLF